MPQLYTSKLAVDYLDSGPADGPVLLLLHGWPDDATTWHEVHPTLNTAGFRTLAPTWRGFGATRFLSARQARSGDTASLATDCIELLDALRVSQVGVVGHDWGSNVAEAMAVGWPDRIQRLVMLSTPSRLGGLKSPPFWHARLQWYHWFQATQRGAEAVRADPVGFARIMWDTWSPQGWFDERTFERVSQSFKNADFVDITLHSYRCRWGEAAPDAESEWLHTRVQQARTLSLPTLFIHGAQDGVNPPAASESMAEKFTGPFRRVLLKKTGHFPTARRRTRSLPWWPNTSRDPRVMCADHARM